MKARNQNRRSQFKARPKSHWKKNLKEQCFRRVKEQRLNLFTKLRQAHVQKQANDIDPSTKENVACFNFNDSFNAGSSGFAIGRGANVLNPFSSCNNNSNNNFMRNSNGVNNTFIFNSNHIEHNAKNKSSNIKDKKTSISLAPYGVISSDLNSILQSEVQRMKTNFISEFEKNDLSQQEFDDLFREMEEVLMLEIKENEEELVAAYEEDLSRMETALNEDVADYYSMINSQQTTGEGRLVCPVCSANYLCISRNSKKTQLQCRCGVNFQMQTDTITLSTIKRIINQALDTHSRYCNAQANFKYCRDNSINKKGIQESMSMEDEDEDSAMSDDHLNGIFLVCAHCQQFKRVFNSQ